MLHLTTGVFRTSLILLLAGCGASYGSNSHSSYGSSSNSGYGASSGASTTTRSRTARVKTVEVSGKYAFHPTMLTVKAGTTVTWTNKSDAPHTVTSNRSGVFNKNLPPGKTVSVIFSHPGTYAYHCTYHPYMHARVVVTR